jgi:hypothetical protein
MRIDRGIPIPKRNHGQGGAARAYGMQKGIAAQMEIGDSVRCDTRERANSMRHSIDRIYGQRSTTTRHLGDGVYRIWRVR